MDFVEYHVENARQFWAELEDILMIPSTASLNRIDSALRAFVNFCSTYHEKYLYTAEELEHATALLIDSDIFAFHSDRSTELLTSAAHNETNPHSLLVVYSVFLEYGRRNPAFFGASASIPSQAGSATRVGVGLDALTPMVPQGKRSAGHKRWQGLIPLLMDHVRWAVDETDSVGGLGVPIEAKLRLACVRLLYEVCRVQKLDTADLKVFDDSFLEHLFETIEDTTASADETLNYYLIKLIVSLNEQFMVASLVPHKASKAASDSGKTPSPSPHSQTFGKQTHQRAPSADRPPNRVLEILMRRLYSSQTFGANIIFMLNRAENTPEDLCMQLLLLKMLYLLFTTPGTHEYFYTNDLRVLVDVFIRALTNLPEESESLRHTYLRVLHPLVTNTQLRVTPYKRPELRQTLLSLISHSNIRDVNPTTKRLVERCLAAEWCKALGDLDLPTGRSLSAKASSADLLGSHITRLAPGLEPPPRSASAEPMIRSLDRLKLDAPTRSGSTSSFTDVADAPPPVASSVKSAPTPPTRSRGLPTRQATDPTAYPSSPPPLSPSRSSTYSSASEPASHRGEGLRSQVLKSSDPRGERRKAPAPPQRRKPPAVPVRAPRVEIGPNGTTITTIASSSSKSSTPLTAQHY